MRPRVVYRIPVLVLGSRSRARALARLCCGMTWGCNGLAYEPSETAGQHGETNNEKIAGKSIEDIIQSNQKAGQGWGGR
jgi:hypothetical protein